MFFLLKTASAASGVKPNTNEWKATLYDDVGIQQYIVEYTVANFCALSNQTSCYIRKCIRIRFDNHNGIVFVICFVSDTHNLPIRLSRISRSSGSCVVSIVSKRPR